MAILAAGVLLAGGCSGGSGPEAGDVPTRAGAIRESAVKVSLDTDSYPPILHFAEWDDPIPMPGPINTAGAEDAPVISGDGNTFLFFFTPDANAPANEQLLDGVTGIWWCTRSSAGWTEPVRVHLSDDVALDGPVAIRDDVLWFISVRAGNIGEFDVYTATLSGGQWSQWQNAGQQLNGEYDVGELYPTVDGETLYFGRVEGSLGQNDLWRTSRVGGEWAEPVNLGAPVNTVGDESRPFISSDGNELWFTRMVSGMGYAGPAIFRSIKTGQTWSEPEEIVSNFVGDPGLDDDGNLYFTHLFYNTDGNKIEADIYVAYRR